MAAIDVTGKLQDRLVHARWEDGRVTGDEELLKAASIDPHKRFRNPHKFRAELLALVDEPHVLVDDFSKESQDWWEKTWEDYRREYLIVHSKHVAFIVLVLVATDLSLQAGGSWTVISWLGFSLLVVYVALVVWLFDFWHEWTPWIKRWKPTRDRLNAVDWAMSFVVLTASFGALTAMLYEEGVITGGTATTSHPVLVFVSYYFWHFLDAIPALAVPATLNWRAPAMLPGLGAGALLLTYKILVIVPVVGFVRALLARS